MTDASAASLIGCLLLACAADNPHPAVFVEPGLESQCSLEQVTPDEIVKTFKGSFRCSGRMQSVERVALVTARSVKEVHPQIAIAPDEAVWVVLVEGKFDCSMPGEVHLEGTRGFYLVDAETCLPAGSGGLLDLESEFDPLDGQ